jgi:FMN reductase
MRVVGVLGSVTPPGRLSRAISEALGRATGAEIELVDLGRYRISFADGRPPAAYGDDTAAVVDAVDAADAVLLATPIYRATFTGALKNLLDQLPVEALQGKPVGIVSMGATQHHYLGADWQLREVLTWFGALVPPTSVYLSSADFGEDGVAATAASALDELLATLVRLAAAIGPGSSLSERGALGPRPLAARRP